ncbi:MAG: N-acetylglucosamine-6-phosphate deacetylase [Spirochaetaceae bacterium]|nr:MAG: N-acetylglucosamine-6-phosphate deacetylase [Spirochaetaceae bacterium]
MTEGGTMTTRIFGRVVTPFGVIPDGLVVIERDRISRVGHRTEKDVRNSDGVLDYRGSYIAPGFVDIHCHSGKTGRCYEDPHGFAEHHLDFGTTGILPTLDYNQSHEEILQSLSDILVAMENPETSIIGVHMEGPYINPKYGAITSPIRPVSEKEYREILDRAGSTIKLWTLAPELDGQEEFMRAASRYGIVFSVGHSEASPDTIFSAYRHGLKIGCHLTNASGSTPEVARFRGTREVGVHEAVLVHDDMYAEVIPDREGIHVRPLMLRLIVKAKGVEKVIIITDATGHADNGEGRDVRITDGNEHTPGGKKETLSGSLLTMNQAVRNMIAHTGVGIVDAARMASLNPATALGLDAEIGSIEPGKKANIVALTDKIDVEMVMVNGRVRR